MNDDVLGNEWLSEDKWYKLILMDEYEFTGTERVSLREKGKNKDPGSTKILSVLTLKKKLKHRIQRMEQTYQMTDLAFEGKNNQTVRS